MTHVQRLLNFAKTVATGYDHEGRGECYSGCRRCAAENVIREVLGDLADSLLRGPYYGSDPDHVAWMAARGIPVGHLEAGR